ncbi:MULTISPECIES: ABC-type transport auxiliary lipoprotein family protein [Nitrosomonas]|uniref:Cholesterol transport system auxiliary component n=1 Tax=Nitrosomonas communis TaxID=44574 RepID=A0A0F7KE87_9PROT|nr:MULTISPECIES: ABC-type transport auxiliary lipoprotein family protein [Nitrosomonas]AKH37157.1 hypothetical protein AAW31_03930 [Nitrosomonas communis]TYP94517.1 cholesterol transport system auxiliary component [Nitrosomonas communis]UVS62330.1 ABC-type transport auxiliary lipoprotein family protein [Nitrosomonas sp. PLL12]
MIQFAIKFAIVFLLLAGCSLAPQKNSPVTVYDFGLQRPAEQSNPVPFNTSIFVAEIKAPVWLDNSAIQYRLAYHDPARSYAYASSRWAASPAKLLTLRIKDHLITRNGMISSHDGLKADYALYIELVEFTQVFDKPDNSLAIIRLRASLIERNSRLLLAQENFSSEQAAPSADAAGAVAAFISASDAVSDKLSQWLIPFLNQK